MRLNEKILDQRKKLGFSQEELANRLGVTRQAVSKWELGESQPDLDMIVKLAKLFGVSTDYLLQADAEIPQEQSHWLDRIPGVIGKLARQYGWVFGLYMAVLGLCLAFMGWFINLTTQPMKNTLEGFEDFTGGSLMMGQTGGMFENTLSPFDTISTVFLIIGGILIVSGIVLAISLKRRNKQL